MRGRIGVLLVVVAGCSPAPASQSDREAAVGKAFAGAEWSRKFAPGKPMPPSSSVARRRRALDTAYAGVSGHLATDLDEAATLYRDKRPTIYEWIVGCRFQLERKGIDVATADLLRGAVAFGRAFDKPPSGIPIALFTLNYQDKRRAGLDHKAAVAWLLSHRDEL